LKFFKLDKRTLLHSFKMFQESGVAPHDIRGESCCRSPYDPVRAAEDDTDCLVVATSHLNVIHSIRYMLDTEVTGAFREKLARLSDDRIEDSFYGTLGEVLHVLMEHFIEFHDL
jgi:hypothetical protein